MTDNKDSTQTIKEHITDVQLVMTWVHVKLRSRMRHHDESKLREPEKSLYDEWIPKLRELDYASDEYKTALEQMGPALQHHYKHNSHHPEHYENGIAGMSLLDLIEMYCDWVAAILSKGGDVSTGIQINVKRYGIDEQLASILANTQAELRFEE